MSKKTKRVVRMALLFALAIALSWLEGLLPAFVPVPGIKLGLSNVVTMYALFFLGAPGALTLAVLKAGFVLLTRGAAGGLLSLAGGLVSVGGMALCRAAGCSAGFCSVVGAVLHNLGQLAVACLLLSTPFLWYYLPVLVLSGVVMGLLTGTVLHLVMPALSKTTKDD